MIGINTRRQVLPGFLFLSIFAFVLYFLMVFFQNSEVSIILPYETLEERAAGEIGYRTLWFFGDMTEAQFYKSFTGGVGLIIGGLIGYLLDRRKSNARGFDIAYGSGSWLWILLASTLGLIISNALYGHLLAIGWIPTFVVFVSVPAGIVLIYGPGWKNALTGAILGGLIAFPISYFVITVMLDPLGLHPLIGNVTGMWVGGIISFEICKYLPWMALDLEDEITEAEPKKQQEEEEHSVKRGNSWYLRRVLADFTEAQFYGNEWASAGVILGTLLMWVLNPTHPSYGSGLFPAVLCAQILTLAISNFLYYDQWDVYGWYPTFIPVVSVAPAVVLTYNGTLLSIVYGALLGAIIGPPLGQMIINKIPSHWHPVVGNTFSMALTTLLVLVTSWYLPFF